MSGPVTRFLHNVLSSVSARHRYTMPEVSGRALKPDKDAYLASSTRDRLDQVVHALAVASPRDRLWSSASSPAGKAGPRGADAVSVSVSFSPVHGRSNETGCRAPPAGLPSMTAGERPCTQPDGSPPQLERVHFPAL